MAKTPLIALAVGKTKPGAPEKSGSSGLGSSKAEALKEMFDAAKRGDFEAAAMAFHDAYEACQSSLADDEDDSDPFASDLEDEE